MMFVDFTTGMPHVQAGKLRALATTRIKRSTLLPGPADHGRSRRHRLRHGCLGRLRRAGEHAAARSRAAQQGDAQIIDSPEAKETLGRVGFEAFSSSPQELEDHIKVQLGKWEKMVKDAGIQPE